MGDLPKVNILLAAYQGEKHIKKQLDSLLQQTYPNITIYIRDDGSKDGTIRLIQEYIAANPTGKDIILLTDGMGNLGCPGTFYQLLRSCKEADYYAFCDQDDVWYPNKVKWAVEKLEAEGEREKPCVYCSSYDYYTETGEWIRRSPAQKEHITLTDVLYYTPASGFVLVCNEAARKELAMAVDPGQELHDRWMLRGAACFGKILVDKRSTAAHIRHAEAVTAEDSSNSNLIKSFLEREICGDAMTDSKEHLRYFLEVFCDRLTEEEREKLRLFTAPNTFLCQIRKLCYPKRLRARLAGELAIRILFLIGKI